MNKSIKKIKKKKNYPLLYKDVMVSNAGECQNVNNTISDLIS